MLLLVIEQNMKAINLDNVNIIICLEKWRVMTDRNVWALGCLDGSVG